MAISAGKLPVSPALTVRAIRGTPVVVPLTFVLGTSQAVLRQVPLLLVDVETEEGVTGHNYVFCFMPGIARAAIEALAEVEARVKGERATPETLWSKLTAGFRLMGVTGVARMAVSSFDGAMWDAASRAAKQPLCRMLGADPRPIRAYNSCGLGLTADKGALAAEAEMLLQRGFTALKLRLGYATLKEDLEAVHAVKKRIGPGVMLMTDYNQALSLDEALERGRALDGEGLSWLEEPIRHDDYVGAKTLRDALRLPIQIGENFNGPDMMADALAAGAADYVMPDLDRIIGVSGWRRAADLAAVNRIEMSSHLFPEVSAHLLAATPTCHFLEYVDWASAILEEPLRIENGHAIIPNRAGNGMSWRKDAVETFRLR
jgi:mandelate racemase